MSRAPVPGYEGLYEAGSDGSVWSTRRCRMLTPTKMSNGYHKVTLCGHDKSQKLFTVHQLVMLCYVGQRPHGNDINHVDGDKLNNHLANLEYCTRAQNNLHACRILGAKRRPPGVPGEKHWQAKLKSTDVSEIFLAAGVVTQSKLAEKYGVSRSSVAAIQQKRAWNSVTSGLVKS